jgi:hypothetical protein
MLYEFIPKSLEDPARLSDRYVKKTSTIQTFYFVYHIKNTVFTLKKDDNIFFALPQKLRKAKIFWKVKMQIIASTLCIFITFYKSDKAPKAKFGSNEALKRN